MTTAQPATTDATPLPEVLCIGETMAMVTSADAGPVATAETFTISPGGAESNLAQHLAELGVPTAWVSALGDDPLGDRVLAAIESSGVDTRWVVRDPCANTGVYVKDPGAKVYYYRRGSAASRLGPMHVSGWPVATARWVHVSGITPALSETCRALLPTVLDAARDAGAGVSFDVNYRPALWSTAEAAEVLRPLADRSDVVLVGRDEAETLWGTPTAEEIAALFPNAGRVVVKDGAVEAVELDRTDGTEVVTRVPARAVDVVEPVGAGDAFGGGYLAALLRGDGAEGRLALGHSLAAWVLGSPADYRSGHGPHVHL
ncbi:2-dehydro-3-deoxygluconokinase [Georgenia soli]|uniref:2-dehydro-3-deoxygluconokinase n=1 Tax=Georgenia soli TaxID=638953 RepID=A0A2A9ELE9_9MICO|nr:sugar kinase [Georgenia soli]PFG39426.1 2-dehydro-3-deoxygluconokinase [Georgenia soli]